MYDLKLTYDELLIIDGKCSAKSQEVIEKAKREHSHPHELELFGQIIEASLKRGTFSYTIKDIRHCPICGKYGGYAKHTRSGRFHQKGDSDTSKPLYLRGIAFNEGFITFQGSGDICQECAKKHNLIQSIIDYIVSKRLPIEIKLRGYATLFKKDDLRTCYACNKEMYESEMGRDMVLMGNGTYPSKCPHCGAESFFLGRSHGVTGKFRMIKAEVQAMKE